MSDLSNSPTGRDGDVDIRRRRLLFRCWHRGMQEIDVIFGSLAEGSLIGFNAAQPDRFEALLDCSDVDLWRLLRASHCRQKER